MTLESVKRSVKDQLGRLDRIYERICHEFDADDLRTALRNLELTRGDTVCVDGAFAASASPVNRPTCLSVFGEPLARWDEIEQSTLKRTRRIPRCERVRSQSLLR